jgi:hypothetical protein
MPLYQMDEEKIEVLKARRLQMQQGIRLKKRMQQTLEIIENEIE